MGWHKFRNVYHQNHIWNKPAHPLAVDNCVEYLQLFFSKGCIGYKHDVTKPLRTLKWLHNGVTCKFISEVYSI